MSIEKIYTCREVAEIMKLAHETVRQFAREGKIPSKKMRGRFYFTEAQIKTILDQE